MKSLAPSILGARPRGSCRIRSSSPSLSMPSLRDRRIEAHTEALRTWAAARHLDRMALAIRLSVTNGTTARLSGEREAQKHHGRYDPERTNNYISTISDNEASAITDALHEGLRHEALDKVWEAFHERAAQIGQTHAAAMLNFGTHEFANQQAGPWSKTWFTRSTNPRPSHVVLDAVTIGVGARFANGLRFPGDPEGDIAERAGCECVLEIGRGNPP
jgi:hypothetical protein